jgi:hypothetical protein
MDSGNVERSGKCGELDQIIIRDGFGSVAGFAPRSEAANDHERIEALFP